MRILLFGGSFDPPHRGHELLLKSALRTLKPDLAYLVPAYQSPLKSGPHAAPVHRLRMVKIWRDSLPAAWRKRVRIDTFELRRPRPSFTFQTVRYFRSKHPSSQIWFLIGSDALSSFSKWKHAGELRKACRWIVGRRQMDSRFRGNDEVGKRGIFSFCQTLPGRFPPISSTDARCRLIAGLDAKNILSSGILKYIRRHGLYSLNIHAELRRTLSSERFHHTLAVASLALRLAQRHGLDAEAAAIAALLHDAGRRFRPDKMARYAVRRRLRVPALKSVVQNAPTLLHAYISEDLARRRFKIHDPAVLSAIRKHTLGAARMSALDRLLYVADSASEDRGFPAAGRIRALARRNLDSAFESAMKNKLRYVKENHLWLHPASQKIRIGLGL